MHTGELLLAMQCKVVKGGALRSCRSGCNALTMPMQLKGLRVKWLVQSKAWVGL